MCACIYYCTFNVEGNARFPLIQSLSCWHSSFRCLRCNFNNLLVKLWGVRVCSGWMDIVDHGLKNTWAMQGRCHWLSTKRGCRCIALILWVGLWVADESTRGAWVKDTSYTPPASLFPSCLSTGACPSPQVEVGTLKASCCSLLEAHDDSTQYCCTLWQNSLFPLLIYQLMPRRSSPVNYESIHLSVTLNINYLLSSGIWPANIVNSIRAHVGIHAWVLCAAHIRIFIAHLCEQ